MVWLVWEKPEVVCENRRACAQDMLQLTPTSHATTAFKIAEIFRAELHQAATTGTLDKSLWNFIRALVSHWVTNTSEIEGVANVIKHIVELPPNISWQLLS
eukprot:9038527-Alexandrium_andersonii.AAC.1